jgi:hypothetical protein
MRLGVRRFSIPDRLAMAARTSTNPFDFALVAMPARSDCACAGLIAALAQQRQNDPHY